MSKFGAATDSALTTLGVVVGAGVLLSLVTLVPPGTAADGISAAGAGSAGDGGVVTDIASADSDGGGVGQVVDPVTGEPVVAGGAQAAGAQTTGGGSTSKQPASGGSGEAGGADCAPGRNGGATDTGVSATSIKLGATVVDDGPGASFLAPVRIAMDAVVNKNKRAGGICGRTLELLLRNDSWQADTGKRFIQNFVESEKVFALAVVPSSEGLRAADSYIEQQGVPVVGTDGMLIHQYQNPWIWPVATSTISTMHVIAKDGYDRGAREFALVFDAKYHFGVEGAFAYNAAVKRLTGEDIDGFDPSLKSCQKKFCGIQPGQSSYAGPAKAFDDVCFSESNCDLVAYLLEPDTAIAWFREPSRAAPSFVAGAQPLFNRKFAEGCGSKCDKMLVWSGYRPPVGSIAGEPAVATYIDDIRSVSSTADVTNQFMEGGYVGMNLLVQALQRTGPNLTRKNLRGTLDSMTYESGLAQPLTWRPGNHFANDAAIGFSIDYKQSFNGFRQETDFLRDPWVGQDIPAGE